MGSAFEPLNFGNYTFEKLEFLCFTARGLGLGL